MFVHEIARVDDFQQLKSIFWKANAELKAEVSMCGITHNTCTSLGRFYFMKADLD